MNKKLKDSELASWVGLYTKELYRWALYKTSDKMLAEDLVQDTFLVASESIDKFDRKSQPNTWLMGILKNKIADYYKKILKKKIQNTLTIDTFSTFFDESERWQPHKIPQLWASENSEHLLDNPAFNQVLSTCLQNLSTQFEACLKLKFLEEKKATEICQELGISMTNYWQHIHRAKVQMRDCIEKNWFTNSLEEN
jgi:RNA polymerase sigma-70 factor (ECF subfamily)